MLAKLRPHLTYANVMATIAVFLALTTGAAYAANTVFSTDIVDGEVKTPDLAKNGVTADKLAANAVSTNKIANNAVNTGKVADNSLTGADIANTNSVGAAEIGALGGAEITNFSLNDEDVGQGTFVNFLVSINRVDAHSCGYNTVTGANAAGDHLVLTPSFDASPGVINYTAEYAADGSVRIKACNPTDFAYGNHTTRFNLLVIDAQ